jgi:hypothetical protein
VLAFIELAAVLGVCFWCLTAPLSPELRRYFLALLVQGVFTVTAYALFGNQGYSYLIVYVATTLPVLACCLDIAWRATSGQLHRTRLFAIPVILALAICRMAYLGLGRTPNASDWAVLAQGFTLAVAGMILGIAAAYLPKGASTAFLLGIFWVVRAVFDLGYALHVKNWQRLNAWVPAALSTVAFGLVGALQRRRWS